MEAEIGDQLVRWSARLSVACYLMRVLIEIAAPSVPRVRIVAFFSWTIGCGLMLAHVFLAFALVHHWSHAAALEHTRRQTADAVGIQFGGGLYFNYALLAIWLCDLVVWWRIGIQNPPRSRRFFWAVQLFLAFMMFNATVVFGPTAWRFVVIFVAVGMLIALLVRRQSRRIPAD